MSLSLRFLLSTSLLCSSLLAQAQLAKTSIDDFDNYTIVGEMGMTITNFGILGTGWSSPDQPSCMYKQYGTPRDQIEMFSYSGLWIGGIPEVNGAPLPARVSTAIVDGVFDYGDEGFEFWAGEAKGDTIHTRSSISRVDEDSHLAGLASHFSPDAISHQDLIAEWDDFSFPADPGYPTNHDPLGIEVHLESYAWSHSFMESFVILDYTITNASHLMTGGAGWDILDLHAGIWADCSVNNMNYRSRWEAGSGFSWYDNVNHFERSYNENGFPRNIGYQYDLDGDDGWSQAYVGFMTLYGPGERATFPGDPASDWNSYFNMWRWNESENLTFPYFNMPSTDEERFEKLSSSPFYKSPDEGGVPQEASWLESPNSWMLLLSAGPFGSENHPGEYRLQPGESVNVVFAVVAAPWSHQGTTNDVERLQDFIANADWAQKAFNGEDLNGNGILDEGEDLNGNNILERYIVPEPPDPPNLAVVAADQVVHLYWDKRSEFSIDPVSREMDFAGYRVYGSAKTAGNLEQYSLLAELDLVGDGIGYDTGFDFIRIKDESGAPDSVEINGHYYHYHWQNEDVLNGWPDRTAFSVTAFDRGDVATGLVSLESSKNDNRKIVVPGTVPTTEGVSVYPNPYRARASWDGDSNRERLIWFCNLPAQARIKIYTLSGDLVKEIDHDGANYRGGDVRRMPNENRVLSGGEHPWDLLTMHEQEIATGMYVFSVEDLATSDVQVGKFLVIK